MNLIEARKLGHDGFVRSKSRTGGHWWRATGNSASRVWANENDEQLTPFLFADLDAEDWEPKPKPVEPFEAEVWVLGHLVYSAVPIEMQPDGWRKIRVREVAE